MFSGRKKKGALGTNGLSSYIGDHWAKQGTYLKHNQIDIASLLYFRFSGVS